MTEYRDELPELEDEELEEIVRAAGDDANEARAILDNRADDSGTRALTAQLEDGWSGDDQLQHQMDQARKLK